MKDINTGPELESSLKVNVKSTSCRWSSVENPLCAATIVAHHQS